MQTRTLRTLAARRRASVNGRRECGWAAAVMTLCLAMIPPVSAAVGDLDVRFGTSGEVEVDGNSGPAVVELPDGRLLVIGTRDPAGPAPRDSVPINRYGALGKPDESFGPAGRVLITLPLFDVSIGAAALQPDGKVVLVGLGSTLFGDGVHVGDSVRFVARVTADAAVDTGFGVNGVAIGGPAGWGGYGSVVVLPSGDILAAIGEHDGDRQIDRFSTTGALTAGTRLNVMPSGMTAQADGRVVVIGQENNRGVLWRLLPDGSLDTRFGNDGYATLSNALPTRLALDPAGQRIAVCSGLGVERFTADGRADTSFGLQDGLVPFDGWSLPKVSRCEGLLVNADGSVVLGASDVQGTASVLHHGYVIGLRPDGSPDLRFDGRGYVEVRTRSAPDTRWGGIALLRTRDQNALLVWIKHMDSRTQTIIDRIDLGQGTSAGAVGVPRAGARVMESAGTYRLKVVRSGNPQGEASIRVETVPGSASSGDFAATGHELTWSDGTAGPKFVELPIVDDGEFEGDESFQVRLHDARGVGVATGTVTLTIVDDDALRALRIVDKKIEVRRDAKEGPSMRVSRDDQGVGPVTAYYFLHNGVDSCCTGRVSWAAGENGAKEVPLPNPVDAAFSSFYWVEMVDETGRALGLDAVVTVSASAAPTPTPPRGVSGGSGSGGGGATTMLDFVLLGLGLGTVACMRRRRAARTRPGQLQ